MTWNDKGHDTNSTCQTCGDDFYASQIKCFQCSLRLLTAKIPRNATQREKNIYEAATRLLANLEEPSCEYAMHEEQIKTLGFCMKCKNRK